MPMQTRVMIGGVQRLMRLDGNAAAVLEDLGFDVMRDLQSVLASVRGFRAFVYATLVAGQMHEEGRSYREPALTLYEVGALLDGGESTHAINAAIQALIAAEAPDPQDLETLARAGAGAEQQAAEPAGAGEEGKEGAGEASDSSISSP
ncbi:MAG TPA: hypothetical protein VF192_10955 [Longimicrobiales bacterium]